MKTKRMISFLSAVCLALTGTAANLTAAAATAPPKDGTGTYEGMKYKIMGGRCYITGYTTKLPEELVIPSEIKNAKVIWVDNAAFKDCTKLKSVSIPETVELLNASCFKGCTALETVQFAENAQLKDIFSNSFDGTPWLKARLEENKPVVAANFVLTGAHCTGKVEIPEGVTAIADTAFSKNNNITDIAFPSTMTSIGDNAFAHCDGLKSLTIPGNITEIGDSAFSDCGNLEQAVLLEGVESIKSDAFADCTSLKEISFPRTLEDISFNVFNGCSALESVTLPACVKVVGSGAFTNCTALKEIVFTNYYTVPGGQQPTPEEQEKGIRYGITVSNSGEFTGEFAYSGVIRGYNGSVAEHYANMFGLKFESLGDAPTSGQCGADVKWELKDDTLTIRGKGDMDPHSFPIKINGEYTDGSYNGCPPWYMYRDSIKHAVVEGEISELSAGALNMLPALESVTFKTKDIVLPGYGSFLASFCGGSIINNGRKEEKEEDEYAAYYNGKICGYEGSTAQAFAKSFSLPFEVIDADTAATTLPAITTTTAKTTTVIGDHECLTTAPAPATTAAPVTTAPGGGCDTTTAEVTTTAEQVTSAPDDTVRGKCGESATWAYNMAEEHLYIDGTGDMADYDLDAQEVPPWFEYALSDYEHSRIRGLTIGSGIDSIGDGSFVMCSWLTEAVVPVNVKQIGQNAFYLCGALDTITILNPDCIIADNEWTICSGIRTNHAFFTGTIRGFKDSTAQKYAEEYGYKFEALENAPAVTTAAAAQTVLPADTTLPVITTTTAKTTTVIGDHEWLTTAPAPATTAAPVTTAEQVTSAPDDTFRGKCGESATWAFNIVMQHLLIEGEGAMTDYDLSKQESAPWSEYAYFENDIYQRIRTIEIDRRITRIGDGAFNGCASVKNVVVPDLVEQIGKNAFTGCAALERITILNPECKIADGALSSGEKDGKAYFDGTIAGFKGSTAQKYAEKNGYKFEELDFAPESLYPSLTMELNVKLVPYLKADGYTEEEQKRFQEAARDYMRKVKTITVHGDYYIENPDSPDGADAVYDDTLTLLSEESDILPLAEYDSAPLGFSVMTKATDSTGARGSADAVFSFLDENGTELFSLHSDACAWESTKGFPVYYDRMLTVVDLSKLLADTKEAQKEAVVPMQPKIGHEDYLAEDYDCVTALGDTNGDNAVSVDDAQLALKAYTESVAGLKQNLTQAQRMASDVNRDGKVTVEDAQLILKYYTEKTVAGKDIAWKDIRG